MSNGSINTLNINGGNTRLTGGNVTGLTTLSNGSFISNVTLGNLTVTGGSANLTGGIANTTRILGGSLTSNATLDSLYLENGTVNLTGGNVTGSITTVYGNLISSIDLPNLSVTGGEILVTSGITTITSGSGANASISGGTLISSANLASLEITASGTANIIGGSVSSTIHSAGNLNLSGGIVHGLILQLHFPLDSVSSCTIVIESGHSLVSATPYRPDPCGFNC